MKGSKSRLRMQVIALAALLVGALALSGCGGAGKEAGADDAPGSNNGDREVVEFKYPDNPGFDLVYLADELGYFEGTSI